jgi:hypothetical protein
MYEGKTDRVSKTTAISSRQGTFFKFSESIKNVIIR